MRIARVLFVSFAFARFSALKVLLATFSFVLTFALEVRNGPEVCMPMAAVVASLEHLDNEVESARLKLLASLEKVLTEGEIESSSVEEHRRVVKEFKVELEKCEYQRAEARLDVETYTRELQELWEIAHVGIQGHNSSWTALSLLGERSVTSVQKAANAKTHRRQVRVSAGVKRAAEMHWGLVKHAQALSLCQQKNGSVASSGNFTEYVNISEDASGPCVAGYQRLRLVYREAYLHISSLLQSAESISESDACFRAIHSLHEERQVSLELKIQTARRAMCQGHITGLEAEAHARKVRERLWATQRLVGSDCFNLDWSVYVSTIESLVQLTMTRPQCQSCCRMANMSSDPLGEAAFLDDSGGSAIDEDSRASGGSEHTTDLQNRISSLRSRWHHAEEASAPTATVEVAQSER